MTFIAARAATDLSLFHVIANVCLTAIGVQGNFGPLQHLQKLSLVDVNAFESLVQCGEPSFVRKYLIKALRQLFLVPALRATCERLQISVELPDLATHVLDILAIFHARSTGSALSGLRIYQYRIRAVVPTAEAVWSDNDGAGTG